MVFVPIDTMAHSYPHCNISTMIPRWGESMHSRAVKTVSHELIRTPKSSGMRGDCCRTISGFEPIKTHQKLRKTNTKKGRGRGSAWVYLVGSRKKQHCKKQAGQFILFKFYGTVPAPKTNSRSNRHAFFVTVRKMHVRSLRCDHVLPTPCSRSLM